MAEDRNLLEKIKDKAKATAEGLKRQYGIGQTGNPWPQTKYEPVSAGSLNLYPNHKTRGFLPPTTLQPSAQFSVDLVDENIELGSPILGGGDAGVSFNFKNAVQGAPIQKKVGQYNYIDWRGHLLSLDAGNVIETRDRFEESLDIPKSSNDLIDEPYSTRDHYLIFGDTSTDYFRHGLHIINGLTPIENPPNGKSDLRLGNFTSTPFEQNDPVIFGFEIIMDDISSPLLNGSILDFLNNYSGISEVASRIPVYEDFKQQFVKFFKTKATVRINESQTSITKMRESGYPEAESNKGIYRNGRLAYLNYYLKKVAGLEKLIEMNTPGIKKSIADYSKGADFVTLSFSEDVTLNLGTLAHLYKLLYWSKPNAKGIIPENLLRFNCDIIVSEVRNFKRVIKAVEGNDIEVVKDNVSRYIYSLRECQLYFNKLPHGDSIDMGGQMAPYGEGGYDVQFDYKYSTVKLERFVPKSNGRGGQYVGYNSGAIWKVGNPGERENRSGGAALDSSVPKFFTVGDNALNQNGVDGNMVISVPRDGQYKRVYETPEGGEDASSGFENFKKRSKQGAKKLFNKLADTAIKSATRELQSFVNKKTAILNRTLNKVLSANGIVGVRPPRNIYTDAALNAGQRIFYDVRGDLINFVGDSIASNLGGGGISGGAFAPR